MYFTLKWLDSQKPHLINKSLLTKHFTKSGFECTSEPFNPIPVKGGGHYGPGWPKSVSRRHNARARLTKIHDFVSFNISWVLLKPFLKFFFEIFLKIELQKFQGSSRLRRKIEKNGKTPNFCQKSYFLRLNLYCTCSQLSFEVYNSSLAKDFIFFSIFSIFQNFKFRGL